LLDDLIGYIYIYILDDGKGKRGKKTILLLVVVLVVVVAMDPIMLLREQN